MANEEKVIKITIDDKEALVRIDNISKQLDALGKNETATKKALIVEQKLLIKNLVEEEKLQQQRIKTLIESERLEQKKIQTTNAANKQTKVTEGYLNELRASVQSLEKAYFQLTEAEYKNAKTNVIGTKGAQVLTNLKEQRAALAEAEAAYGKHNLNVGNYSSATKMLGINLGQVMKEMPNFAISARIGIMSLTNNLPMLAESIKAVRVEQQAMIAEGKKAPSMFSLMSKSIFGLTGAMSIAMVLMQIYGADIIEWAGSLFKASKATDILKESQDNYVKSLKEGGKEYANAVSDAEEMAAILISVKKGHIEETEAIKKYNETFGDLTGNVNTLNELEAKMIEVVPKYVEAMAIKQEANLKLAEAVALQGEIRSMEEDQTITFWQKFSSTVVKTFKDLITLKTGILSLPSELMKNASNAEQAVTDANSAKLKKKKDELDILIKEYRDKFNEFAATGFIDLTDDKKGKAAKDKLKASLDFVDDILSKSFLKNDKYIQENMELRRKELDEYAKLQKAALDVSKNALEQALSDEYKINELGVKKIKEYLKIQADAKVEANRDDFAFEQAKLDDEYAMRIAAAKKVNADTYFIEQAYKVKTAMLTAEKYNAQLQLISSFIKNTTGLFKEGTKAQKAMTTAQISVDGVIAGFQAFNVAAYKSGIPIPYNYIAGGLAAAGVAAATASAIKEVWAVDENGKSGETSTTSVTEKFHTGTYRPSSANEEKEITRTLLTTERVLSPAQTSIFDSMIGRMQSYGGSNSITSGIGDGTSQEATLIRAFSMALSNQKPPQISWTEFSNQAQRQQQLENNRYVR